MARIKSEAAALEQVAQVLEVSDSLRGKSFSITGHLGLPRKEIVELITNAGGEFHSSPTYYTKFLITNKDWNANSTVSDGSSLKLKKAMSNGTKVISEKTFLAMLTGEV